MRQYEAIILYDTVIVDKCLYTFVKLLRIYNAVIPNVNYSLLLIIM